MEITLKSGRKIGHGHPCFIVAEVGSNWTSLDDCLYSIRQAKHAGADAVKFQAYSPEALYGWKDGVFRAPAGELWKMAGTLAKVKETALPLEWLPKLKHEADKAGIEFMCTAFSPELVDAVNPYVSIHKVASAELTHVRLLERIRQKGKPVFLSTGASGLEDIRQALGVLESVPVIPLYCVASYPARRVQLATIEQMATHLGLPAGYSDHTTDVYEIPRAAADNWGAVVLEKHVTFIDAKTPDSPHSLSGGDFTAMVSYLRDGRYPGIGPTQEEQGMILRHNRRLIATQDIPAGALLTEGENFGIYRSLKDDTKALSPWAIDSVNGRHAKGPILAGDGIGPQDIE
jgi:sialic acid synthase SpsE